MMEVNSWQGLRGLDCQLNMAGGREISDLTPNLHSPRQSATLNLSCPPMAPLIQK